jgi:aminoglycoside 6'-N-acetyltransferase
VLRGRRVVLRSATADDVPALAPIRDTEAVRSRWDDQPGQVAADEVAGSIAEADGRYLAIEVDGRVVGAIQWSAEEDPMYAHAGVDLYLDPDVHGQGIGEDAVRTLCAHLVDDRGHHRLVIDPAADNAAAIRCYTKVGFRPVGVMRAYERSRDGTFHDGLLMDLLPEDLVR